ncbi:MAG: hypothetical protein KIT58_14045, partial [Planctomycetota bacterium]|nr:hypothetical protein [Planctomycetota bacterium]
MSRLGVTGEEFWSVAEVSREAAAALPDDHGTTIDAPARVVMSRRDTLPVVGVHTRSFRDVRPVPFQRRAVLVASRVESREAVAGRAFLPKKQPPSPPPPPPDDDTPDGFVNTDFVLDARARLEDLPWRPGTLVLWLVDFDRPTPPAKVELVRTESTDPAVAEFLARRSGGRAYPAAVWPVPALPDAPQGALPRYAADEASPPLPED